MYEFRWVIRPGWNGPVKELQYRVRYTSSVVFSALDVKGNLKHPSWSPWTDIPVVDLTSSTAPEGDSGH